MYEFDEDFEELREGESVYAHMLAGAAAGVAEHTVMFPLDTVKTNIQAATGAEVSMSTAARRIFRLHGVSSFFRGMGPLAAGAAPAHALHFATYEFWKKRLHGLGLEQPLNTAIGGACATVVSDGIMTPTEAIKQRMQLRVNNYRSAFHCATVVARREGLSALYASYSTTLLMNVPYHGLYFASYEFLRSVFKKTSEREFDAPAHWIAGGGAGSVAAALTTPMDVAKTRLQIQGETLSHVKYRGMAATISLIFREEGWAGVLRGVRARMLQHSVQAATCWVVYEYVKLQTTKFMEPDG